MERIAFEKLIDWNNNKRKKPLIVWGARQVGKTYLVKEIFAETYYKNNYIYVDCKKEDEIREFCSQTANAEKIIEYISLRKGKQISEKTLLIFDEVQECPNIISALKYFCQDFREVPVIATGSMVRIKLQRETHKRGFKDNDKLKNLDIPSTIISIGKRCFLNCINLEDVTIPTSITSIGDKCFDSCFVPPENYFVF